jgi:hypothetical protein
MGGNSCKAKGKQRKLPLKFRKNIPAQVDGRNKIRASWKSQLPSLLHGPGSTPFDPIQNVYKKEFSRKRHKNWHKNWKTQKLKFSKLINTVFYYFHYLFANYCKYHIWSILWLIPGHLFTLRQSSIVHITRGLPWAVHKTEKLSCVCPLGSVLVSENLVPPSRIAENHIHLAPPPQGKVQWGWGYTGPSCTSVALRVTRGYSWLRMDHYGVCVVSFVRDVRVVVDGVILRRKMTIFLKTDPQFVYLAVLFATSWKRFRTLLLPTVFTETSWFRIDSLPYPKTKLFLHKG